VLDGHRQYIVNSTTQRGMESVKFIFNFPKEIPDSSTQVKIFPFSDSVIFDISLVYFCLHVCPTKLHGHNFAQIDKHRRIIYQ
jgi:hypothetical protein